MQLGTHGGGIATLGGIQDARLLSGQFLQEQCPQRSHMLWVAAQCSQCGGIVPEYGPLQASRQVPLQGGVQTRQRYRFAQYFDKAASLQRGAAGGSGRCGMRKRRGVDAALQQALQQFATVPVRQIGVDQQ